MPRKRFGRDSGPRVPAECHSPTGPAGGSPVATELAGLGYSTAAAGKDAWQLYSPNTCLPWNQISIAVASPVPSGFESQWNPTGPTGPALGSASAVVASSESMEACAFAEVRVVATDQYPRPVAQFSSWSDVLASPALYLDDNHSKAADAQAELFDCDYCTKKLPSLTAYRSDSRQVFFYETQVVLGTKESEAAVFVDAFSLGSGRFSACATADDESGESRIGMAATISGAPPAFLAVVPASPFDYLRQGSYFYMDRVPTVQAWNNSPTDSQIRIPSGYISSPATKIGRYVLATRPTRFNESWSVGNIQFRMWHDGEELDLSQINSNPLLFYGEYADVSAFTTEEGAYRFRIAYAEINFSAPGGTQEAPSRVVPLDYGVEFGWVQDFTRPRVAIQCPPSAATAHPKYFPISSTEEIIGVGASVSVTLDGEPAAGSYVNPLPPFELYLQSITPGRYRINFSALSATDKAGNSCFPANDVEWEIYAEPSGPDDPLPPISGWIAGVSGVMPDVNELTLRFSAPVVGATELGALLSVNGEDPEAVSIVGEGDTYRIVGLSEFFASGKSYFLSVEADQLSPAGSDHDRVAGPVCAAWVTQADGPPDIPSLDTQRVVAPDSSAAQRRVVIIGNEYSVSAAASVPGVNCDNTSNESSARRDLAGYRITTAANSLPAFLARADGSFRVLSAASALSSLHFPTGPAATGPSPVGPPATGPTGSTGAGPTGSTGAGPLPSRLVAVSDGFGWLSPLTLRSDRLYEHQATVIPQEVSRGLGHAIAMTAPHRHAQWSAGRDADNLEIEIKVENYKSHPLYTKASEIGTSVGLDALADCWSTACLAGTYSLSSSIGSKSLAPCQYYAEAAGTTKFEFEQGPPNIPAGEIMESTDEISLDPDWVTLYEKATPDDPNNVSYDSEGIYVGWQSWPPGAESPTPSVPAYLSNLKGAASSASFSLDGEESREFTESVVALGGDLPPGSTKADYDSWSDEETGVLAGFYDDRYQGTAKTWKVQADSIQVIAKVAREVPVSVSKCGEVHGNLGLLRVYVRIRAMYTVDIDPVRLWKVKWRARPMLSFAAQDRSGEATGVILSTTYWVMQGRRIVIDNVEQKTTRSTKRERFFAFDFLLSQEESAQLEAGNDVSRRIEIVHRASNFSAAYQTQDVPQIIEVILRLPDEE